MTPQEVLDWAGTVFAVFFMVALAVFITTAVASFALIAWKEWKEWKDDL